MSIEFNQNFLMTQLAQLMDKLYYCEECGALFVNGPKEPGLHCEVCGVGELRRYIED